MIKDRNFKADEKAAFWEGSGSPKAPKSLMALTTSGTHMFAVESLQ